MPYAFALSDKSVTRALRRIAGERFAATAKLVAEDTLPRLQLVHELRKNVKKSRALLRLVRPGFERFEAENAALRDASRMIAALREADVLAQTFDRVAERVYLPPDALAAVRASVIRPHPPTADAEAVLKDHAAAIAKIARRTRKWELAGKGFDALEEGLERSWSTAKAAMRAARTAPSGEALHLWRKRVKDHWYHARLLQPIWPEMMAHHMAAAGTLGETLGDARDLAFLAEALADLPDAAGLRAAALEEETRLLAEARALGRRLLSEPGPGLARRWRGWWDIWQEEG